MSKDAPTGLYDNAVLFNYSDSPRNKQRERGHQILQHKFEVGQMLSFSPSIFEVVKGNGPFRVVKLLPADSGDNQYRVQSECDGHERVVRESQLSPEQGVTVQDCSPAI
jgi:hypothetical protein